MKQFIKDTIGTPYDIHNRVGLSCWGLVAKYYHTQGYLLKEYVAERLCMREINRIFTEAFRRNDHGFVKVHMPKDGDVVVFKSKHQTHCGLCVGGKVLHSSASLCGVGLQPIDEVIKNCGFTEIEYWTYDKD